MTLSQPDIVKISPASRFSDLKSLSLKTSFDENNDVRRPTSKMTLKDLLSIMVTNSKIQLIEILTPTSFSSNSGQGGGAQI